MVEATLIISGIAIGISLSTLAIIFAQRKMLKENE